MIPPSCSQAVAKHAGGIRAGLFLPSMGLSSWAVFALGLLVSLAEISQSWVAVWGLSYPVLLYSSFLYWVSLCSCRPQYSLCQEQHGHSSESFAFLRCKTGGKQGDNQGEVLNCDIKIVMLACPASYTKKQFSQRFGCTWHWQPSPPAEPHARWELTLRAVGVTQSIRPFNTARWHDAKSEVISPGKSKESLMGKLEMGTTFSLLCWVFFLPQKTKY